MRYRALCLLTFADTLMVTKGDLLDAAPDAQVALYLLDAPTSRGEPVVFVWAKDHVRQLVLGGEVEEVCDDRG